MLLVEDLPILRIAARSLRGDPGAGDKDQKDGNDQN
jgi:hypothetical protein